MQDIDEERGEGEEGKQRCARQDKDAERGAGKGEKGAERRLIL